MTPGRSADSPALAGGREHRAQRSKPAGLTVNLDQFVDVSLAEVALREDVSVGRTRAMRAAAGGVAKRRWNAGITGVAG